MRALKILPMALVLSAIPLTAAPQQLPKLNEVVDKIVAQEQVEVQLLRQYSPIVETYIQTLRPEKGLGAVPNGDKYYLGRGELAKGVELEPLLSGNRTKHNLFGGLGNLFSTEFMPRGFLQMIYLDTTDFDRAHYKFDYAGREFLGEVRCLVFDSRTMGLIPSSISFNEANIPEGQKPTTITFLSPGTGLYLTLLSVFGGDSFINTEQDKTYTGDFPLASIDLFSIMTAFISERSFPNFLAAIL